jgi:hypothetical protein
VNAALSLPGVARAWAEFFHAPASPLPLALFRIAFGSALLVESMGLWRCGDDLFGGRALGVVRRGGDATWLFRLHSLACACLALGFLTRAAAALVFVHFCFRTRRNWLVIQGGDNVAKLLGLLLVFSNAGGVLSIDHLLHLGALGGADGPASQWPLRLMQIQISIVYLRTASWKLRAAEWLDGSAAFHALHRNINLRGVVDRESVRALVARAPVAALLTWGTLAAEIFVGVFVWFDETRYAALAVAVALHLGFELFLSIKQFQWIMLSSLLLFVTARDWATLAAALARCG